MIKKEYVIHIQNLKEALNHGLVFKKVQGVIKCNQRAGIKPYIDVNIKLRKEAKCDFEKSMQNVRKPRDHHKTDFFQNIYQPQK